MSIPFHPRHSASAHSISVFFFFLILFSICGSGHLGTYDAAMEYEVTKNFLRNGSFDLRDKQFLEMDAARGIDGRLYSPHGLGQSVAMVPFYLVGEGVASIYPAVSEMRIHHFFVSFMNILIAAILCVLMFLFQMELGFPGKIAFYSTCILGTCTLIFPYSKVSFDVMLTACLLFGAIYSSFIYRKTLYLKWALVSGALLGYALITRIASVIVLPFYMMYLGFPGKEDEFNRSQRLKGIAVFFLPLVTAIMMIAYYNFARFGTVMNDGHATDAAVRFTTPLWLGFIGQTISPGKGLFLYAPVLIFAPFGLRMLYRVHKLEAFLVVSVILVNIIFYSKLSNWSGDWCWGPRFTVLIIPFLCVGLGALLHQHHGWRTWLKLLWIVTLVLSFGVQMLGVTIDGTRRIGHRYTSGDVSAAEIYWDPGKSPICDHARLLHQVSFSPLYSIVEHDDAERMDFDDTTADFWFVYLASLGFPRISIVGCLVVLIGCEIYLGYRLIRILVLSDRATC